MEAFRNWCTQVTDQVRFWPDRKAIVQELTAHYEDHVRDLERLDYPLKLAEQRALDAMGDPEEIGKALDRVHKPWLGWLWVASRVAVRICLALLLVYSIGYWQNVAEDLRFPEKLGEMGEYEPDGFHYDPTAAWTRETVTAGGSVDRCGYHISLPYAALWGGGSDDPYYAASILLTVEDNRFWDDGPAPALQQMSAVDDRGVQYTSSMEYFDYPVEERRARWGSYIQVGPQEKTPFYETYWVTIYFRDGFRPRWLELTCESGEGFTFRLEWEEGK